MLTITKTRFEFAAAHYLPDFDGACKNLHGHNYFLDVEITGPIDSETYPSMILDFGKLKKIVNGEIIQKLDHGLLNDVAGLEVPTAERMVMWIVTRLRKKLGDNLVRVRLYETSTSYAEWRRG